MPVTRPVCILIAAMGGEGGGVLTGWITGAAQRAGFPVQATSIPGVAQRTGATTYYIEIWPGKTRQRPVMSLNPAPGQVDVMIASEFVEAGRAIANGFVTPDRTLLIASTHRVFAIAERSAMGDGRYDTGRLFRAAKEFARTSILFDMDQAAKDAGSILNAVLLGALAGSGALPLDETAFEAGIRDDGKSVDSNLAGFRFGLSHGKGEIAAAVNQAGTSPVLPPVSMRHLIDTIPEPARKHAAEAVLRLIDYQDEAYARRYLKHLEKVAALGNATLTAETARHLALRMSFEDVIRVAQLKLKPERFAAIERETKVAAGQVYTVADFVKPGIEEIASLLPSFLARPLIAVSARYGWLDRVYFGMTVRSNRLGGYIRFRMLAALRGWRPASHRFAEEQARIEDWLGSVHKAAALSPGLAREIVECARLIKGYGDTFRRGLHNYEAIRAQIIRPVLDGRLDPAVATDALVQARTAALADPEGDSVGRTLSGFAASVPFRQAAE